MNKQTSQNKTLSGVLTKQTLCNYANLGLGKRQLKKKPAEMRSLYSNIFQIRYDEQHVINATTNRYRPKKQKYMKILTYL